MLLHEVVACLSSIAKTGYTKLILFNTIRQKRQTKYLYVSTIVIKMLFHIVVRYIKNVQVTNIFYHTKMSEETKEVTIILTQAINKNFNVMTSIT